jgi:hypothetical protein
MVGRATVWAVRLCLLICLTNVDTGHMAIAEAVFFLAALSMQPCALERVDTGEKRTGESMTLPMEGGLRCRVVPRDLVDCN